MNQAPPEKRHPVIELALLFLKLGTTSFGGPAAHTALMEREIVRQRQWLTRDEFLDLVGATNLIPGPNSTELAIHIGQRRAGWPGLVVAGSCFILPAALMVGIIAWAYVRFGALPQAAGLLYGIKPVIIAVVAQALWGLGRTAIKSRWLAAVGLAGATLNLMGVNELGLLFSAGLLMAMVQWQASPPGNKTKHHGWAPLMGMLSGGTLPTAAAVTGVAVATPFSLGALGWFFLKVGSVLFGSGYVLLAFLRADLVERYHWLTENQLLDAIAVGQFTPGPVFTTATFIGYLLSGSTGALVATAGIFLPAFFFVVISGPLIPRLRASPIAGAFLDGVNVISLALMAVVTWQLGVSALVDWWAVLLTISSGYVLLRFRVNSAWLVLGGAVMGGLKVWLF